MLFDFISHILIYITIISNEYSGVKTKLIEYFSDRALKKIKELNLTSDGEFSTKFLVKQEEEEEVNKD